MGKDTRGTHLAWGAERPGTEELYVPIASPKPGEKQETYLLADRIVSCLVHFVQRPGCKPESKPHWADAGACPWCALNHPRRWKGYFPGLHIAWNKLVLVEITSNAARAIPALVDPKRKLRGKILRLWRRDPGRGQKPTANAPIIGELETPLSTRPLPPPLNVQTALMRIWGELDLDTLDAIEEATHLPANRGKEAHDS